MSWGFIMAPPTPFNTIAVNLINQSYNAFINYANRNASSHYSNEDIAKSYIGAVSAAIGLSLGCRMAFQPLAKKLFGPSLILFNSATSFLGIAAAGYANTILMRQAEKKHGIDILTAEGKVVGKSKMVASYAIEQTAISRIGLAAPIFLPALIMIFM